MKKLYMAVVALAVVSLAGCTFKVPTTPEVSTWEVLTWTELTWEVVTWEVLIWTELTWEVVTWEILTWTELTWTQPTETVTTWVIAQEAFNSGVVPMISGSNVTITTGQRTIIDRFKSLINKRNVQPKDETKLVEEDIDLMEDAIKAVQNIGKNK